MKRALLAMGLVVLGTSGALAQWDDYRRNDYRYGASACWSASQRAREFEWRARGDGRVTKDEWRIIGALRAQADRACSRTKWRNY